MRHIFLHKNNLHLIEFEFLLRKLNILHKDEINTEIHKKVEGEAQKMEQTEQIETVFGKLDNNLSIREKAELTAKQLNNENYFLAEVVEMLQTTS